MLWIDEDQMNSAVSSSTMRSPLSEGLWGLSSTRFEETPPRATGYLTTKSKRRISIILIILSILFNTLAETSVVADTRIHRTSFFPEFR